MLGQSKIPLVGFQGVWNRGDINEVPPNHLTDALNVRYSVLGFPYTREGSSKGISLPFPINDWFLSKRPSASSYGTLSELLIADGSGNIYASSTLNKLLTVAGSSKIFGVNLFGRTYFCVSPGGNGLYLYDGNQTRLAGGSGPPATPAMTVTVNGAGNIPLGTRAFWVAFQTNTGFITPPGAQVQVTLVSNSQITLNSIPIGPSNTVARMLLSTQANGTILYFIPLSRNGVINDNVTTSVSLNFYDTDLQASANYLQNLLTVPQSGGYASGAIFFSNRLIIWPGPVPGGGGSTAIGSRNSDPESFDQTSCYLIINRDDGFNITTAFVWNNLLYFCKDLGVYSISDNGQEPSYWQYLNVDGSVSIAPKGIATLSSENAPVDTGVVCADKSGLLVFSGVFQRPELSWKVAKIWSSINKNAWSTVNIAVDPIMQAIYCALPLNNATSPNYILYGDYSRALSADLTYVNPMAIKWDLWKLPNNSTTIGMIDLTGESYPTLRVGSIDNVGNLIQFDPTKTDDYGYQIDSYIQTGYLSPQKSRKIAFSDFVSYFNALKMNAYGSGTIIPTCFGLNGIKQKQFNTFNLQSSISVPIERTINFTSPKMSLKLECNGGKFNIEDIYIYCRPMMASTPK